MAKLWSTNDNTEFDHRLFTLGNDYLFQVISIYWLNSEFLSDSKKKLNCDRDLGAVNQVFTFGRKIFNAKAMWQLFSLIEYKARCFKVSSLTLSHGLTVLSTKPKPFVASPKKCFIFVFKMIGFVHISKVLFLSTTWLHVVQTHLITSLAIQIRTT